MSDREFNNLNNTAHSIGLFSGDQTWIMYRWSNCRKMHEKLLLSDQFGLKKLWIYWQLIYWVDLVLNWNVWMFLGNVIDSNGRTSSPELNGISDESSSSASSGDESPVKENKEESKEKEDEAKNDEQEMVLIQDTGFNVKIVVHERSLSL